MFASWTSSRREKLAKVLKAYLENSHGSLPSSEDREFWVSASAATAPPPMGSLERTRMHLEDCERYVDPVTLCEAVHRAAKDLPSHKVLEAIEKLEDVSSKKRDRSASASRESTPAKRITSALPADMRRSQSATGLARLGSLVEAR